MLIKEIMTHNVEVVGPDDTLQQAARKMRDLDIGPLPVCDGQRLVGLLTDRDIAVRAVAEGLDPKTAVVSDAMSPQVAYCFDDQDVREAARLMKDKQIRRLPVMSRANQLVGIVSLGDLATETSQGGQSSEVLKEVSQAS